MAAIAYPTFQRRLLKLYEPPQRAPKTFGRMAHVLTLVGALDDPLVRTTEDLTQDLVSSYVCSRTVRANTVLGELGYLKAACCWAEDEGYLRQNPFRGKRKSPTAWIRPEPPRQKPWHPHADLVRLLAYLETQAGDWQGHRLYALTCLVALTGLRREEALHVQLEDIDWSYPVLRVMGRRRLKTYDSAAPVPIAGQLDEVLRSWLPHAGPLWLFPGVRRTSPWVYAANGYRPLDRLARAGEAVGIQGLTFQSLRHSWATHAESNWQLRDALIQRCLRHTTPMTSKHYKHADLVNLVAAVRHIGYRPSA
jgi:integrase